MGFLAPWFLGGLALLGLPLYLHLLRHHTQTPKPVSSLMFFERGTQSSTRHRRLRHILLFVLRLLVILVLILLFANPFIRRSSASSSNRLLLIAVDNSFSMRAGTRLQDAKNQALSVLAARHTGQRAQVLTLGGEMQLLTQPIEDSEALRAAVSNIQPTDGHSTFGELGRGIRAMAETVHTPVELHLFSDMQSSNMPGNFAEMVLPGNVTLVLHPVAKAVPNWTVESVDAPAQIADPKHARVLAVISGHQTPAATRTVSLVVNGKVTATKQLNVPADGRATIAFDGLDVPYGDSRCQVKIDAADGFAADDAANFAVRRADPERVLFVHPSFDSRSPLYFGAALAAAAQASFVLQPIDVERSSDADSTHYAFVVLSDVPQLPSLLENSLLHAVQNGSSVLIALGSSQARGRRIPLFGGNVTDVRAYNRQPEGFSTVGQMDAAYPALKDANNWADTRFLFASVVDPGNARVVARLADGTPLLLDKQIGQGHILLFTSGFDNLTNDLPLHPSFVPFVDQAARSLSGSAQLSGARLVDSFVQLRNPSTDTSQAKAQNAAIDIIGPDGRHPLSLAEESTAQVLRLSQAGFYQIHFPTGRDALIAVNPDRRESALDLIPDETLKLWSAGNESATPNAVNAAAQQQQIQTQTTNQSLWWWFMLLLLIAALAEALVASRYLGTQREEI
ncbi:MAG TPA: VWA domain-containing protein [Granulicella sp.]